MSSKQIRTAAWESLRGNYGTALLIAFIGMALISVTSASFPFGVLVAGPIMMGMAFSFLKITRSIETEVKDLFFGFEASFVNSFLMALLMYLFTFLWSLLFIIPGIIKYFSYSMAPYVLADNPDMKGSDAIDVSKELMKGNKWKLFCLYFSFIGWFFLACLTWGIGILFLYPYIEAAKAEFFKSIISTQDTGEQTLNASSSDQSSTSDEDDYAVYQ